MPTVACPCDGCDSVHPVSSIRDHIDACLHLPHTCKYKDFGCNFVAPLKYHAGHSCKLDGMEALVNKVRGMEILNHNQFKIIHHATLLLGQQQGKCDKLAERLHRMSLKEPADVWCWLELFKSSLKVPDRWQMSRNLWHNIVGNEEALSAYATGLHLAPVACLFFGLLVRCTRIAAAYQVCHKCESLGYEERDQLESLRRHAKSDNLDYIIMSSLTVGAAFTFFTVVTVVRDSDWGPQDWDDLRIITKFTPYRLDWLWRSGACTSLRANAACVLSTAIIWLFLWQLDFKGTNHTGGLVALLLLSFASIYVPNVSLSIVNCNRFGRGNNEIGFKLGNKFREALIFGVKHGFTIYILGLGRAKDAILMTASADNFLALPLCFFDPESQILWKDLNR